MAVARALRQPGARVRASRRLIWCVTARSRSAARRKPSTRRHREPLGVPGWTRSPTAALLHVSTIARVFMAAGPLTRGPTGGARGQAASARRRRHAAWRAICSCRGSRRTWVSSRPPCRSAIVAVASAAGSAPGRRSPRVCTPASPTSSWIPSARGRRRWRRELDALGLLQRSPERQCRDVLAGRGPEIQSRHECDLATGPVSVLEANRDMSQQSAVEAHERAVMRAERFPGRRRERIDGQRPGVGPRAQVARSPDQR
jgi:hypothetical protein